MTDAARWDVLAVVMDELKRRKPVESARLALTCKSLRVRAGKLPRKLLTFLSRVGPESLDELLNWSIVSLYSMLSSPRIPDDAKSVPEWVRRQLATEPKRLG